MNDALENSDTPEDDVATAETFDTLAVNVDPPDPSERADAPATKVNVAAKPPAIEIPDEVSPLQVTVKHRFGYRNLRGKPTKVPTGHLDIFVDGRQQAWSRKDKNYPIRAIAEFLDHEIPQIVLAVREFMSEDTNRRFVPNLAPSQEEIDAVNKNLGE